MARKFYLILCCFTATLFFCCHHSDKSPTVVSTIDTLQINDRIKAKQKNAFAIFSDSVKLPSIAKKSLPYFSITRFYYDSVTKELFKAENVFPVTGHPAFMAYFDKNHVVKTIARTEFGWYDYYFSKEGDDSLKNKSGRVNRLRQQCFQLASKQLSVFQRKIKP